MPMTITVQFPKPTIYTETSNDYPLGAEFLGAIEDGPNWVVTYLQKDMSETLTKTRTFEFVPPTHPLTDEGRNFIAAMPAGWVVFEKTELTLPDDLVRRSA